MALVISTEATVAPIGQRAMSGIDLIAASRGDKWLTDWKRSGRSMSAMVKGAPVSVASLDQVSELQRASPIG